MPTHDMREFLARSTDRDFGDTTLGQLLLSLPDLSSAGPWLAGGALRRTLLAQEPSSDLDFFFRDADQLLAFAASLEFAGMTKTRETEHHVEYRGKVGDSGIDRIVQLIRFSFYSTAQQVIDSFDYTICQFVFDGTVLTVGDYALWDLGRKRLAIHKIRYPLATMRRMIKYTSQGFTACAGCMATILRETAQNPQLQSELHILYVD